MGPKAPVGPITVVFDPASQDLYTDGKYGVVTTVEPTDFDRLDSSLRGSLGVWSLANGL
jgi:hypothetical protein